MRLVLVGMPVVVARCPGTDAVRLRHPQTGKTVQCGPRGPSTFQGDYRYLVTTSAFKIRQYGLHKKAQNVCRTRRCD